MIEFEVMLHRFLVLAAGILVPSLCVPGEEKDAAGNTPPPDFLALNGDMIAAFQARNWSECIRAAKVLAASDPRNYLPAYYLAVAYSEKKDEVQGAYWLERTLEANHPDGGQLRKDPSLAWLVSTPRAGEVFRRRDERIAGRWEGVLRHQRFDFKLPLFDDPRRKVGPADFKGKVLAVVIVVQDDDSLSSQAAGAIEAIRVQHAPRMEAVALHLQRQHPSVQKSVIERFRSVSGWNAISVTGAASDLFPLEVVRYPAVVFFDAAGTPRFIEEGYKEGQTSAYRKRVESLLEEEMKAGAKAAKSAGEDPARKKEAGTR